MRSEEEVRIFLTEKLRDKLLPLENYRKKNIRKVTSGLKVLGVLSIFLIVSVLYSPIVAAIIFLAMVITAGITFERLFTLNKKLRVSFKYHILKHLLEFLFDDFSYLPHQRISKKALDSSLLISGNISRVEGEDYMRFRLGETAIHFSEIMIYGQSNNYPNFRGVFLSARFNKNFRSETIVMPRKFKVLAQNFERILMHGFRKVKLEDPEFSKHFIVLSNDQVESRYLLTTSMMQRLLEYKQKTKKHISFSFTRNLLNCAVPNYVNLFEPALFESFFDFAFLRKSYDAIKLYTDIVEDLNLNVRIWSSSANLEE